MHVTMPSSVESMAVSNVQSMKVPFGSSMRWVGSTRADMAGVGVGVRSRAYEPASVGDPPWPSAEDCLSCRLPINAARLADSAVIAGVGTAVGAGVEFV